MCCIQGAFLLTMFDISYDGAFGRPMSFLLTGMILVGEHILHASITFVFCCKDGISSRLNFIIVLHTIFINFLVINVFSSTGHYGCTSMVNLSKIRV
jgi:hypothetical protein